MPSSSWAKQSSILPRLFHCCKWSKYIPLKCQKCSFVDLFQPVLDGQWLLPEPMHVRNNRPNLRCDSHSHHVPGSQEQVSQTQDWEKTTTVTSPKCRGRRHTTSCLLLSQLLRLTAGLSQSRAQVLLFTVSAVTRIKGQSISWGVRGAGRLCVCVSEKLVFCLYIS